MSLQFCRSFLSGQPTGAPIPHLATAGREGLDGLVAVVLARQGRELPGAYETALRRHFTRNAGHLSELARIGDALQSAGLRALILKGASLLGECYRDLAARPMGDLDLLVRPEDRGPVRVALRKLGYRPGDVSLVGPGAMVDLHTRLMGWESVRPEVSAYRFPQDRLWQSARQTAFPAILRLAPEHQALHLAVHALKHGYERLLWLVDLALVLPHADPERLAREAREARAERALAYGRHLTSRLFQMPRDRPVRLSLLERIFLDRALARRGLRRGGKILMALELPVRQRMAYLAQLVFPARSQFAAAVREQPAWRRHAARLVRILLK
ncbi:MAG: nucleotidyltransferase family protein [Armatimonadetes bacterium]|nr:nucleotidyltransferase family protein [Armatimonadota bacterium]